MSLDGSDYHYTEIRITFSSEDFFDSKKQPIVPSFPSDSKIQYIFCEAVLKYANSDRTVPLEYFECVSSDSSQSINYMGFGSKKIYKIIDKTGASLTPQFHDRLSCYKYFAYAIEKDGGNTVGCGNSEFLDLLNPTVSPAYPSLA
jgi:hypothetical protein